MNYSENVKIIVYLLAENAKEVRVAMFNAGAGVIGDYVQCSWSTVGEGRFTPAKGSNPTIGSVGKAEVVKEERTEILCPKNKLQEVITAMKKAHPYEEVAYDVYERLEV